MPSCFSLFDSGPTQSSPSDPRRDALPSRPTPPPGEFLYLLAADHEGLIEACTDLLPADIADALSDLPPDAAAKVVAALPFHLAVQVFDEPSLEAREELIERLPDEVVIPIIQAMSADRQVGLFRGLKEADRARLLHVLDAPTRDQLRLLMSYPPRSAGGIMTTEFVGIPASWNALDVRKREGTRECHRHARCPSCHHAAPLGWAGGRVTGRFGHCSSARSSNAGIVIATGVPG